MKRYKLKKDLPTFKAGQECWLGPDGELRTHTIEDEIITVHSAGIMRKFPNILTDWFEEIPEKTKTVWDLEDGDKYWVITSDGEIDPRSVGYIHFEEEYREIGNAFITKEEAEKELARRKAKVILERDTKGFKPDWQSGEYDKYEVAYDYSDDEYDGIGLFVNDCCHCCSHNGLWFATEEDAQYSIEKHEKEWKIYLGVEE